MTLRREIDTSYVQNLSRYLAIQKALIREAFARSRLMLFAQGELFEKFFFFGRQDLCETRYDELYDSGWAVDAEDDVFRIYAEALFFSTDVPTFVKRLSGVDLATGFRLHGVLPSLGFCQGSRQSVQP